MRAGYPFPLRDAWRTERASGGWPVYKGCKMLPALSDRSHERVEELRSALQSEMGPRRYAHWFGGPSRLEYCDGAVIVRVSSPYLAKWIQKQFEPVLRRAAQRLFGREVGLRYEVEAEVQLTLTAPGGAVIPEECPPAPSVERRTASPAGAGAGRSRRTYSLADIVIGEANALALTAVQAIVEHPGEAPPLYLHSAVGNGKTHLLHAMKERLRREHPQFKVLLLTAEQFGNYFSQALGARSLPSFRARFRSVDALLVDDVDFFDGKKGFQEEFLHTVKQFEAPGRQLVVTANRHPRLLQRTSEELVSRYLAGVACRLEAPDEAMRVEIVQRFAARQRASLPQDVQSYLAQRFTSNARELEGAVHLLATWMQMSRKPVTLSLTRKLLGRLERDCLKVVRLADIEAAVSEFFGVAPDDLRSASRKQTVAQPRMLAMYLARKLTPTAYSEIGAYFGGRNHSTVMSAEKKIDQQLQSEGALRIASQTWTMQEVVQLLHERIKAG